MELYHGSNLEALKKIKKGQVDVSLGGGELGKGFYCGDLLYRAKAWSYNRHNCTKVIKIKIEDDEFLNLSPLILNGSEAKTYRKDIKRAAQTRTYLFNKNAVWSPVVGLPSNYFNQVKWESKDSEELLNSQSIKREII